jgi:DNA-binding NtrC family response regulator
MLARRDTITEDVLHALLPISNNQAGRDVLKDYVRLPYVEAKDNLLADFTKNYLHAKLVQHDRVISKAAENSGITRQHFSFLMKRYFGEELPDE